MLGERLAVQRPGEERFGRQRLLAIEAASELLIELELLRAPLDFLFAVIRAEEHELARRRLDAGRIEDGLQRHAGPLAVSTQPVERSAIPRALEPRHEVNGAQLLEIVERQRL